MTPSGNGEHRSDLEEQLLDEVEEEAGLRLPDPAALVKFSRWITPPEVKIRFDTLFLLAPAPDDARPPDQPFCRSLPRPSRTRTEISIGVPWKPKPSRSLHSLLNCSHRL